MVKFKSIPAMFVKEKDGRKPNTIRLVDEMDERFEKLYNNETNLITIENTETGETVTRVITDVSVWNKMMIVSWRHED